MASKVLVIEDISINLSLLTSLLQKHGYEVQGAENVKEGLKYAKVMKFDLILCDFKMQGGENARLVQMFKSEDRLGHIPIVALSALTMEQMKVDDSMIAGYIAKPAQPGIIIQKLESIVAPGKVDPIHKENEALSHFDKRAETRKASSTVNIVDGFPVENVLVSELKTGMIVGDEILDGNNNPLAHKGVPLTDKLIEKLKSIEIPTILIRK